jgi:homoserine dehydrogenase
MSRVQTINVGLVGLGTVGTGVARIITESAPVLERRTGARIRLKRIADLDLSRDRGLRLDGHTLLGTDAGEILADKEIQVVIELIGGREPAKSILLEAMERKKHVITANKALLASEGTELFEAAVTHGVEIGFEAAVGGGIPIIRALREGLVGSSIASITGIINGTANYILSTMTEEGGEFGEVLERARREGYAEADPALDIDGHDTAHKLVILTALAYGIWVRPEEIFTEGIRNITSMDIHYARELGYKIKLLALCKRFSGGLEVRVHPTMIPVTHMLAPVGHVYNAIYITGDHVGPVMFYGKGAGMMPTGSAVVSDLVDIVRSTTAGCGRRMPPLGFYGGSSEKLPLKPINDLVAKYYIRFPVVDKPGVLSMISGALGRRGISIHSVIQKGRQNAGPVHIIMLTHESRERDLLDALAEVDRMDAVLDTSFFLRIEDSPDQVRE